MAPMSTSRKKRLPGQSNAEYAGRPDPNADFLDRQSLTFGAGGGHWLFGVARVARALILRKGR